MFSFLYLTFYYGTCMVQGEGTNKKRPAHQSLQGRKVLGIDSIISTERRSEKLRLSKIKDVNVSKVHVKPFLVEFNQFKLCCLESSRNKKG